MVSHHHEACQCGLCRDSGGKQHPIQFLRNPDMFNADGMLVHLGGVPAGIMYSGVLTPDPNWKPEPQPLRIPTVYWREHWGWAIK